MIICLGSPTTIFLSRKKISPKINEIKVIYIKKSTHINLWQSIDLNIIRTLSKNVNILTFIVRKFKYIQVNKLKKNSLGNGANN